MDHEQNLNESFEALLICNGAAPVGDVLPALAARAGLVVCADGGANIAYERRITPQLIIGDLDSMLVESQDFFVAHGTSVIHDPGQDDTDFEKALRHLRARNVTTLVIAGMTGLLLDHTLGNFSILQRYVRDFRIVVIDPQYRIDVITSPTAFAAVNGQRISILPFPKADRVTYDGLKYPAEAVDMKLGEMEGTCNEARGSRFSIDLTGGALLVFRPLGVIP